MHVSSKYHFITTLLLNSNLIAIHTSNVSRYDLNHLTVKGSKADTVYPGLHISQA